MRVSAAEGDFQWLSDVDRPGQIEGDAGIGIVDRHRRRRAAIRVVVRGANLHGERAIVADVLLQMGYEVWISSDMESQGHSAYRFFQPAAHRQVRSTFRIAGLRPRVVPHFSHHLHEREAAAGTGFALV
jgi:hypothetical protein